MKNRIAFKLKCSVELHVYTYMRCLGTKMDVRNENKILINVYKLYNFEIRDYSIIIVQNELDLPSNPI